MSDRPSVASVIEQFNLAFQTHDPSLLDDLVGENCVMEAVDPAPNGTRYGGADACLDFWRALANDQASSFAPEAVDVLGDRAIIRWRYTFGPNPNDSVRGVNLMRVENATITEALGYVKSGDTQVVSALDAAIQAANGERT